MINYYNIYANLINGGNGVVKGTLHYDEELNLMENIIDGDSDGDFLNIYAVDENGETSLKKEAIRTLIDHLSIKLTADSLSVEQKEIMVEYINTLSIRSRVENYRAKTAEKILAEAILMIISTESYAVK
jgi:hypothetical protein